MRRFLVLLAVLALVSVACTRGATSSADCFAVQPVDRPLPTLQGEDLDGKPISTDDFRGDVLVINAWATWCDPCAEEQPTLVAAAKRYAPNGVRFLGINHMDNTAAAKDWVRSHGVQYPSISDPSGKFAASLDYFGLPDTYVVDPEGTIRFVGGPGAVCSGELSSAIDAVLAQTSASSATAANSPAK